MAAKVSLMCLIAHIFKNPEPVTKLVAHFIVGLILKSAVNFVFCFDRCVDHEVEGAEPRGRPVIT